MTGIGLATALAAILSLALTGLATWYARRRGLIDHPGDRQSHVLPTPRGGGAGLILAFLVSSLLFAQGAMSGGWMSCLLPAVLMLAITGWWDDHRPLSARIRLLVQLAATAWLLVCLQESGLQMSAWLWPVAVLFVVWMSNLYNFMDGSNGMAGAQGVFSAAVLAWLFARAGDEATSIFSVMLAASCLGFLPWNLRKARVFMGDVGSVSLGFSFAALLVYGAVSGAFNVPVALMVLLPFLVDSTLTLIARVLKRERWYNAHRQHLYQQIIIQGWTHGRVLLLYQAINLVLVLPGIAVAVNYPAAAWPIALALSLALGLGWYLSIKRIGVLALAG